MSKVRDARRAKKQSQIAVAEAMGVSESVYQRIERGEGRTTPEETKAALAAIKAMPKGTSSVTGRPYAGDKSAADLDAALEADGADEGDSADEDLLGDTEAAPEPAPTPAPAKKAAAKKAAAKKAAPRATAVSGK